MADSHGDAPRNPDLHSTPIGSSVVQESGEWLCVSTNFTKITAFVQSSRRSSLNATANTQCFLVSLWVSPGSENSPLICTISSVISDFYKEPRKPLKGSCFFVFNVMVSPFPEINWHDFLAIMGLEAQVSHYFSIALRAAGALTLC